MGRIVLNTLMLCLLGLVTLPPRQKLMKPLPKQGGRVAALRGGGKADDKQGELVVIPSWGKIQAEI